MKRALAITLIALLSQSIWACSCSWGWGFCESYNDPDNVALVCIPIQKDSISARFVVLEVWDTITLADTITIWDDSLRVMTERMSTDSVYRYECVLDPKEDLIIGDTIALITKRNYPGSGFGAPNDLLFDMHLCKTTVISVERDSLFDQYYDGWTWTQPIRHIDVPTDTMKRIFQYGLSCRDYYVVGINDEQSLPEINFFPNGFQLSGSTGIVLANIYNLAGQRMWQGKVEPNSMQEPILQQGVYIITLTNTKGHATSYKWYKEW